ncbi:MAG: Sua5/YciO/YrdC/YwlC family protein, partial [Candidatus Competibacteraceae bacterium]|nr:Sua5/YciO/YrdC/YwlC family protein [Candidatus Competibacteraceae bacterium]
SANRSGRPPLRTALAVRRQLGREVDAIVAQPVGQARRPSTIRTLDDEIVRAG